MRGPSSMVLAAVPDDGEGMLGTVVVGHDGRRGWVHHLAAADPGHGVGRALMAADVPQVQLMIRADDVATSAATSRCGGG